MLFHIQQKNYNFLINPKNGKWFGFLNSVDKKHQDKMIDKNVFEKTFCKHKNFLTLSTLFTETEKDAPLKNNLLKKLNYLVLHTSDLCNMKCKYCYATDNIHDSSPNIMSAKTMLASIEMFFDNDDFYVLFHGREPLTNIQNIIKTVEHFKDNEKIHFILQTNGTLLTDNLIKQLSTLNVKINISIDGFDDQANCLRINGIRNNYTEKVTKLLEEHKEISPIIIIHKHNIEKIESIIKQLKQLGHNNCSCNFLWPTGENAQLDKLQPSNEELFKQLKNIFLNSFDSDGNFKFIERDLYLLYGRIAYRHINNYMCNKSPCGAGKICICVNHNGDVYPCTTVNNQPANYMGNIFNDNKESILSHDFVLKHRNINEIDDCKKCPFAIFCGGGACSGFLYNYKKNINVKSIYCNYYKNMITFMMKLCIELCQDNIFKNF